MSVEKLLLDRDKIILEIKSSKIALDTLKTDFSSLLETNTERLNSPTFANDDGGIVQNENIPKLSSLLREVNSGLDEIKV